MPSSIATAAIHNSPAGTGVTDRHSAWNLQALWDTVVPWLPGLSIEVMDRVESTNQELVERLRRVVQNTQGRRPRADDLLPTVLVAVQQTRGRGRMGRDWLSSPGASLTFSLSLPVRRADWSGLSLAVGWAVAQALDPAGRHIGLKWPNDLWLLDATGQGRKLGGVLIEALPVQSTRMAVIGIGINIQPMRLQQAVASLSEFDPAATAASALARVLPVLAQTLERFERQGFAGLAEEFRTRDLLHGQTVVTTDPACPQGLGLGVDADGALLLGQGDRVCRIVSGEVSVRPVNGSNLPAVTVNPGAGMAGGA
jgi:BirA family biotin operon repressor/biotin-[acetyl-CoA-carboxylase] ligase